MQKAVVNLVPLASTRAFSSPVLVLSTELIKVLRQTCPESSTPVGQLLLLVVPQVVTKIAPPDLFQRFADITAPRLNQVYLALYLEWCKACTVSWKSTHILSNIGKIIGLCSLQHRRRYWGFTPLYNSMATFFCAYNYTAPLKPVQKPLELSPKEFQKKNARTSFQYLAESIDHLPVWTIPVQVGWKKQISYMDDKK